MPDPSSGPSGWWGIATGFLSFLLAAYSVWESRSRWKTEEARRKKADEKTNKPKLTLTYVKAEKTGSYEYTLPGFEIKNIGDVPAFSLKVDFVFEPSCAEQTQKQIKERINVPSRLDPGTNFQGQIFLGPGGSIYFTLIVNADGMDEMRWSHRFVRG